MFAFNIPIINHSRAYTYLIIKYNHWLSGPYCSPSGQKKNKHPDQMSFKVHKIILSAFYILQQTWNNILIRYVVNLMKKLFYLNSFIIFVKLCMQG